MKQALASRLRSISIGAVLLLMLGLLAYVALRTGPLAPVSVRVITIEQRAISPALFGIGTVEAQFTHRIGPVAAGRVQTVLVQPGDSVKAGQLLGEMDPVDMEQRIGSLEASRKRAEANLLAVQAQLLEANVRSQFAQNQVQRYEQLLAARSVSTEAAEAKRQELQIAQAAQAAVRANQDASRQDLLRAGADIAALTQQRANLRLVTPVNGIVTRRNADRGTTVVAGQAVVEVVEPSRLWIHVRFDQQRAYGLRAQLPAQVLLRSQGNTPVAGQVLRVEPHADAVTEEVLAKVVFAQQPQVPPPIGELAEVTVQLGALPAGPAVPNASIHRVDGRLGVWLVDAGDLRFAPVRTGASDLDGNVQILDGLAGGEQLVVYSFKAVSAASRIKLVDQITGQKP
ncbi:MAG: efflux RND transporter periplasmic adaptor subunit [Burkholderiaceae bacterium]